MNKKGMNVILMIGELLVISIIIFTTIKIAHAYGSSLLTAKMNSAEDVRMMIDVLVGVPGDAEVVYPHDVSPFTFNLQDNSIIVLDEKDNKNTRVTRAFFLPNDYTAQGFVENPSKLCMKKRDTKITLFECET